MKIKPGTHIRLLGGKTTYIVIKAKKGIISASNGSITAKINTKHLKVVIL